MARDETAPKIDRCEQLSVKALRPLFDGGRVRVDVTWPSGIAIRIRTDPGYMTLAYKVVAEGWRSWPVKDRVYITWTSLHFGGRRPWFYCPGCQRRVGVLYLRVGYFRCRNCHRLRYRCKSETPYGRALRKVRKLEGRLGDRTWIKPKGMHQTTFDHLHRKLRKARQTRDDLFIESCLPLLRRCRCL